MMYTLEQRAQMRDYIIALARADRRITAGALIGSLSTGSEDEWSDIDLTFGVADDSAPVDVLRDWTAVLDREFTLIDFWDLHAGPSIYRVFLLHSGLEVDVSVTPATTFGARGSHFSLLFGASQPPTPQPPPDATDLIGRSWHHVLHARASIERGKPWQAEYWISAIRDNALALACIRLGESPSYGKGIDHLPAAVTAPFAATFVRSLDEAELRRALAVVTTCLMSELVAWDLTLSQRLQPILQEFGATAG